MIHFWAFLLSIQVDR